MDKKFYTLIVTVGKDGMPMLSHILSGHLNEVYVADLPSIPVVAESDEDAVRIAGEIIAEQKRKIIQYLTNQPNQE